MNSLYSPAGLKRWEEAVAYAPESIATVLANARAGAPWRTELGLAEPSQSLSEAMCFISRATRALCSSGGAPTVDELHVWCRHDRLGEHALEKLVRRVLRSTLEPLRARQAMRPGTLRTAAVRHDVAVQCDLGGE